MIAAQIASLEPDNIAAEGLDRLEHATDVGAAGRAAEALTAPVQNLLVADRRTIGLFTTGRVPIRRQGDGSMASDGADGMHDWIGYASGQALPHLVSPVTGLLVNANEPVVGSSSTVAMGRDVFGDWRSERIKQLLARPRHRFEVADFVSMQGDVASVYVERLLPTLRTAKPTDPRAVAALHLLDRWGGVMSADQPQPLIVEAWLAAIGDALAAAMHDDDRRAMAPLTYVDQSLRGKAPGCAGSCVELLSRTLQTAVSRLVARYGDDPAKWRWGTSHHAVFANPFWNGIPMLRRLARSSLAVGGDSSTVDAQGVASTGPPFEAVHGASFRAVYDLADLDRSRFVIATGQSGNPFSRHLLDFSTLWHRIDTITIVPFVRRPSSRLVLTPAARGTADFEHQAGALSGNR